MTKIENAKDLLSRQGLTGPFRYCCLPDRVIVGCGGRMVQVPGEFDGALLDGEVFTDYASFSGFFQ